MKVIILSFILVVHFAYGQDSLSIDPTTLEWIGGDTIPLTQAVCDNTAWKLNAWNSGRCSSQTTYTGSDSALCMNACNSDLTCMVSYVADTGVCKRCTACDIYRISAASPYQKLIMKTNFQTSGAVASNVNVRVYPEATCSSISAVPGMANMNTSGTTNSYLSSCLTTCSTTQGCKFVVFDVTGVAAGPVTTYKCTFSATCPSIVPAPIYSATLGVYNIAEVAPGCTTAGCWNSRANYKTVYSVTVNPTPAPTFQPTAQPTAQPTKQPTAQPTVKPTVPTAAPTKQPTVAGTTPKPTTLTPTLQPSTAPTKQPTLQPTLQPSEMPTKQPSPQPTFQATTPFPSNPPTKVPTPPTNTPTKAPTDAPTIPISEISIQSSSDTAYICTLLGKSNSECVFIDPTMSNGKLGMMSAMYLTPVNQLRNYYLVSDSTFDCTKVYAYIYRAPIGSGGIQSFSVQVDSQTCLISWDDLFETTAELFSIQGSIVTIIKSTQQALALFTSPDAIITKYVYSEFIPYMFTTSTPNPDILSIQLGIYSNPAINCNGSYPDSTTFKFIVGRCEFPPSQSTGPVYTTSITRRNVQECSTSTPVYDENSGYTFSTLTVGVNLPFGFCFSRAKTGNNVPPITIKVALDTTLNIMSIPYSTGYGTLRFTGPSRYNTIPTGCGGRLLSSAGLQVTATYTNSYLNTAPSVAIASPTGTIDGIPNLVLFSNTCVNDTVTQPSITTQQCESVYKTPPDYCLPMRYYTIEGSGACTFDYIGAVNVSTYIMNSGNALLTAYAPPYLSGTVEYRNCNEPSIPSDVVIKHEVSASAFMGNQSDVIVKLLSLNELPTTSTTLAIQRVNLTMTTNNGLTKNVYYDIGSKISNMNYPASINYFDDAFFCRYVSGNVCAVPFHLQYPKSATNTDIPLSKWSVASRGYYACQDIQARNEDRFAFRPSLFGNATSMSISISITAISTICDSGLPSRRMLTSYNGNIIEVYIGSLNYTVRLVDNNIISSPNTNWLETSLAIIVISALSTCLCMCCMIQILIQVCRSGAEVVRHDILEKRSLLSLF